MTNEAAPTTTATPQVGELWNDTNRNTRTRIPVRIQAVDTTHATVTHELDGETLEGARRIHLSHFGRPGGYVRAETAVEGVGIAEHGRREAAALFDTGVDEAGVGALLDTIRPTNPPPLVSAFRDAVMAELHARAIALYAAALDPTAPS